MKVHVISAGPILTNGYLLTDSPRGEAVLVDAPQGVWERIQPMLAREGCVLKELWLTHGHWDHMQDAALLKRETGALVRAHRADRELFEQPDVMEEFMGEELGLEPVQIDAFVEQGQLLTMVGREFEVRHVPGHCPGNVLFHTPKDKIAFVGDAIFRRGVGRWDFPGGDFNVLANSIRSQIYTLPDETILLSGHGLRTSVGEEKNENPFVPADVADRA